MLIYRGPHWMDEDDNGITKYESLQLFIDNYRSGLLTPSQKYKVIRYLVNLGTDSQINKVIALLLQNGIVLKPIEKKEDLLKKLDQAVKKWANLSTEMKDNIIAWADDVISLIPQSKVIDFKSNLSEKYNNRYQLGAIVDAFPDGTLNQPFSSKNKCSPLNISDLDVETARGYIKTHRIAFEYTPQVYQDRIASQEMFSVTASQIIPFLELVNG